MEVQKNKIQHSKGYLSGRAGGLPILLILCLILQINYGYTQAADFKLIWETAKKIDANESNLVVVASGGPDLEAMGITVGAKLEVKGNPKDGSANVIYGGYIRGYGAEVVLNRDIINNSATIDASFTKLINVKGVEGQSKVSMKFNPSGEISNVEYEFSAGPDQSKKTLKLVGDASGKITASGSVTYQQHVAEYTVWSGSANFSTNLNTGATTLGVSSNLIYHPPAAGENGGNLFFKTSVSTTFSADGNNGDNKIMFDLGLSW